MMTQFKLLLKTSTFVFFAILILASCSKQETTVGKVTPSQNFPDNVGSTPPTQNPGTGERLVTDPICSIPLIFPPNRSPDENETMLNDLIEQPAWITGSARVQRPDEIEPPVMMCLFSQTLGSKPQASIRLEYEDRYGRVQYTLKDAPERVSQSATLTTEPAIKKDKDGNTIIYTPSYFVRLEEENFEIFMMPSWGFLIIKGKKEADGFFHAKVHYLKLLNAPIEPYYLSYTLNGAANTADIAKIEHCTGDSGQATQAKITHPDRPAQPAVACSRAHRFVRSAFRGPYDYDMERFKSHEEYTGIAYDYRVEMIRQYTDESTPGQSDFQTVLGQKPKLLGTIKFRADQIWAGVAP